MKTKIVPTLFALAGLTFLFSAGASAQPPQNQPPPAQQQQMEVDNATLEQFAAAMNEVAAIQQEYSQQLSETQDPAEAQSIQQEAQTKMVEAVLDSGLDVETYNTIAQQAASDPELQGRIEAML
ncbi:MAG: DUF4168 domain-containing protein [Pseudohongiellaceae bacterium]